MVAKVGPYQRQSTRRNTDGTLITVRDSFSEAWREGKRWTITLEDDGAVKVRIGPKPVVYYKDASDFAADFFPDISR